MSSTSTDYSTMLFPSARFKLSYYPPIYKLLRQVPFLHVLHTQHHIPWGTQDSSPIKLSYASRTSVFFAGFHCGHPPSYFLSPFTGLLRKSNPSSLHILLDIFLGVGHWHTRRLLYRVPDDGYLLPMPRSMVRSLRQS
jgi:hypothetical protein